MIVDLEPLTRMQFVVQSRHSLDLNSHSGLQQHRVVWFGECESDVSALSILLEGYPNRKYYNKAS